MSRCCIREKRVTITLGSNLTHLATLMTISHGWHIARCDPQVAKDLVLKNLFSKKHIAQCDPQVAKDLVLKTYLGFV